MKKLMMAAAVAASLCAGAFANAQVRASGANQRNANTTKITVKNNSAFMVTDIYSSLSTNAAFLWGKNVLAPQENIAPGTQLTIDFAIWNTPCPSKLTYNLKIVGLDVKTRKQRFLRVPNINICETNTLTIPADGFSDQGF